MTDSIIYTRPSTSTGTAVPTQAISVENSTIVTNTTTIEKVGDTVTDISYIPYMKAVDIDFVGYRLRVYTKTQCY
jgi:hypothetical protein